MFDTVEVQTSGSLFLKPYGKNEMREILLTVKENIGLQIALGDDRHTLEHAQGKNDYIFLL